MNRMWKLVALLLLTGVLSVWPKYLAANDASPDEDTFVFLPLVLGGCVPDREPGDYVEEIMSSGQTRQYRLHIPPNYQQDAPLPLVINLHGYNSYAEQQERVSAMPEKADQSGFIAVHPEALGDPQTWHFGPEAEATADVTFIRDLIIHLQDQLCIDPARIYVTGMSNGAQMTHRLGCDLSDLVAAIAPVAGGYLRTQACNAVRPLPVVGFHGTEDNLLPYEGSPLFLPVRDWAAAWATRNGCNPTPTVTFQNGDVTGETWSNCQDNAEVTLYTVEGGGHSWPGSEVMPPDITTQDIDATDAMWDFFQAHPMP